MCCRSVEKRQHGRGRRKSQDWNRGGMQAPVHQTTPSLPGGARLPPGSSTWSRSAHFRLLRLPQRHCDDCIQHEVAVGAAASCKRCVCRLTAAAQHQFKTGKDSSLLPCRHAANASRARRVHTAQGSSLTTGAAWTSVRRPGYSRSSSELVSMKCGVTVSYFGIHIVVVSRETAVCLSLARLFDFTMRSKAGAALH